MYFKRKIVAAIILSLCTPALLVQFGGWFNCEDGQRRLRHIWFCDHQRDCRDRSDEKLVESLTYPENLTSDYIGCDNAHDVYSVNKVCALRRQEYCKGNVECVNMTYCDAGCPSHFQCPGSTCFNRSTVCDGDPCNDCPSFQRWNNGFGFKCVRNNRTCLLPQLFLWDGVQDCDDGSDLCYTSENGDIMDVRNSSIDSFNDSLCFQCENDSMIIPRSSVCDGIIDCPDMSDECNCTGILPEVCQSEPMSLKRCDCFDINCVCHNVVNATNSSCQLTKDEVCKMHAPCDGDSPCENLCPSHFRCSDSTCWKRSSVCDGDSCNDCADDSTLGSQYGFKCIRNGKACNVPQRLLYDTIKDCDDSSDLCYVLENGPKGGDPRDVRSLQSASFNHSLCFSCMTDGSLISMASVCDGIIDCQDMSDESLCERNRPNECNGFLDRNESMQTNCSIPLNLIYTKQWRCVVRENSWTFDAKLMCDGKRDCIGNTYSKSFKRIRRNDENPLLCHHRMTCETVDGLLNIPQSKVCDGTWDCKDHSDETVSQISLKFRSKVCDGFIDCKDGSDEFQANCTELGRINCSALNGAKVSISQEEVCDFVINCDDQSDESNCNNDGRFYCENKQPLFVKKEKKFNGFGDCSDWSDECPTKTKRANENIFSSRYELIANPLLRALVWIMAFLAIGGNVVVMVTEVKILATTNSQSASFIANHLLVLNLSVSDLLMGVYLFMLGVAGLRYSGNYCANDLAWRSSTSCSVMGVLVLLSSETSVITMVLLTSFRLYAVKKPFNASIYPKLKFVILSITMAWLFSFTLAFIPLTSSFQHLFETKAWMKENPYFENAAVDFSSMHTFMGRFINLQNNVTNQSDHMSLTQVQEAYSWNDFIDILNDHKSASYFEISGYLGYYSSTSVCISKLYVTPQDKAWTYSIAVVTLNFLAFMFVAATYIWIYKKSTASAKKVNERARDGKGDKKTQEMQKKVIRLIFTDFLSWVPISIMSFVNFAGAPVPPVIYAVSAIILLPVNSALNPLIYSYAPKVLYDKARTALSGVCPPRRQRSVPVSLQQEQAN